MRKIFKINVYHETWTNAAKKNLIIIMHLLSKNSKECTEEDREGEIESRKKTKLLNDI